MNSVVANDSSQQRSESTAQLTASASFSGPLPHPSVLKQYNQIMPDAAGRIIAMAEREQNFAITAMSEDAKLKHKIADSEVGKVQNERLGMICSWMFLMTLIGASVYLTISGHPHQGLAGVIGSAAVIATSFLIKRA